MKIGNCVVELKPWHVLTPWFILKRILKIQDTTSEGKVTAYAFRADYTPEEESWK